CAKTGYWPAVSYFDYW
nr:immunoglobulin heavy chain junction region [Macaca mulatta]MOW78749.1 immunoglobulin heavy chain junction region [Macaca mulatta]MOW82646.1 immunoglobulin heavy chain junction region [Macaca mulatta]